MARRIARALATFAGHLLAVVLGIAAATPVCLLMFWAADLY